MFIKTRKLERWNPYNNTCIKKWFMICKNLGVYLYIGVILKCLWLINTKKEIIYITWRVANIVVTS